jgi:YD repeat-containing protein
LFLESIQEHDNQSAALPPYTFDYNTTILPNRFSNSQDVWGYYNGANNGQFLTFFNYSTFNVDRSVNSANSEAGLLNKITYPTGGYTQFTYEQNIALPNPDLNELVYQSINPAEETENGLGFLETSYYDGTEYTKPISIGNIVGVVDVSNFWVQNVNIMDFTFSIEPSSGGHVYRLTLGQTTSINLGPGDYYLIVTPKNSGFNPLNWDHAFNISLSWKEQSVNESDSVYAGGKRIIKLENKLPDNSSASIREFKYKDSDGVSSGKIFGMPNCYSINKTLSTGAFKVFRSYGAVPGSPLSMGTDNSIGYTSVVEYLGSISNNTGKTEYKFTDIENTGTYYQFPYTIPTDNEWLRGKPLSTKNYKRNTDGTFELVRKTQNEYFYGGYADEEGKSTPSVFTPFLGSLPNPVKLDTNMSSPLYWKHLKNKILFRFPLAIFAPKIDDNGVVFLDITYYKIYYLTGGTLDLKKTITTEYTSGVPTIVTSNEYFYNYDDHYQLSRTETTNSNGIVNKKNFRYPQDYDLGVENFNTLITNNIVGKPIDVRTYYGSNLASGSQTRYNNYGQPIDVYRFESTATDIAFSANNPYTFSHKQQIAYNSSRRIKRATPDNDISTYYVWAYNNQYPVVKIETNNASLAIDQIQSSVDGISLSESQSTTLVDSSISSLQTAVGAYVSSSDMVTYYTYTSLSGMTSQTDPNGVTTYYEYDSFGRLKCIKDDDGHILKTYEYHYKQ